MNTCTESQTAFISRLTKERVVDDNLLRIARDTWRAGAFTKEYASAMIRELLASPKTSTVDEPEAGIYRVNDDHLVRVYHGQQSGRMLAKGIRFDRGVVSYEYLGAASRVLTPGTNPERLTVEEVGELGKSFDHCLMCGHRLDDPESVDRGIGPVCAVKYA